MATAPKTPRPAPEFDLHAALGEKIPAPEVVEHSSDSLEDLAKFIRDTAPLLEKFKPRNDSERAALQDAIDKAKQTESDTKQALITVPKTEKKRKP